MWRCLAFALLHTWQVSCWHILSHSTSPIRLVHTRCVRSFLRLGLITTWAITFLSTWLLRMSFINLVRGIWVVLLTTQYMSFPHLSSPPWGWSAEVRFALIFHFIRCDYDTFKVTLTAIDHLSVVTEVGFIVANEWLAVSLVCYKNRLVRK